MSYDPRRKKKKGRKKGKSRKKRSYDPTRGMAYGYGQVRGKPYRIGRRGGVAWSGGRKPRYDPQPRRFGRIRRYGTKAEGWVNKYGGILGFFGALIAGIAGGYTNVVQGLKNSGLSDEEANKQAFGRYVALTKSEFTHLYKTEGDWNPLSYLKYKFLGIHPTPMSAEQAATTPYPTSSWVLPFWASLVAFIGSKLAIHFKFGGNTVQRIARPVEKISKGALVASTIGALVLAGTRVEAGNSNGLKNIGQPLVREAWA